MRAVRAARWALVRHPAVALLVPVVVASGVAGFAGGQVAGRLSHGLALTPTVIHQHQQQRSGPVQGALGQRVGVQVANQPAVRLVNAPPSAPPTTIQTNAHARRHGSSGAAHGGEKGKGKGDHGKHGRDNHGDHGDHGKREHGGENGGGNARGIGGGNVRGDAGSHVYSDAGGHGTGGGGASRPHQTDPSHTHRHG